MILWCPVSTNPFVGHSISEVKLGDHGNNGFDQQYAGSFCENPEGREYY